MNLSIIDYVIEPASSGSPNVVALDGAVLGIYTDDVAFDDATLEVYTSFDGVTIHALDGLVATLAASILWVPVSNTEWGKLRSAGPYFALDNGGESLQHNLRLLCRGVK